VQGVTVPPETQLTISFDPPKFDTIKEVINHVAYSCGKQIKFIAAELDMAPQELSQILAGTDGRRFPAEKLPIFIRVTAPKGHEIIYWLIDQFLSDQETRKGRALAAVEAMLLDLLKAVEELKK
jgi:hypothetical protein